MSLERAKGIEPSYAAWEAAVLPLNYARGRLASPDLAETTRSAKRLGAYPRFPPEVKATLIFRMRPVGPVL